MRHKIVHHVNACTLKGEEFGCGLTQDAIDLLLDTTSGNLMCARYLRLHWGYMASPLSEKEYHPPYITAKNRSDVDYGDLPSFGTAQVILSARVALIKDCGG